MAKTFDEWWDEAGYVVIDYAELNIEYSPEINYTAVRIAARIIWEESRHNMTTKDI